jgi:glycyl-tRNA synthetase
MREFEQMEMEFFVEPGTDEQWHEYWIDARQRWYLDLGIKPEHLRLREHGADELSHYAKRTVDIEYAYPWTDWGELEGVANRGDYDLKAHEAASGEDLTYFDQEKETRFHPFVIEPAGGRPGAARLPDRCLHGRRGADGLRAPSRSAQSSVPPDLAPVKVAVPPLSRNERLIPEARRSMSSFGRWIAQYDDAAGASDGAAGARTRSNAAVRDGELRLARHQAVTVREGHDGPGAGADSQVG